LVWELEAIGRVTGISALFKNDTPERALTLENKVVQMSELSRRVADIVADCRMMRKTPYRYLIPGR
jgi:hypothetical protein